MACLEDTRNWATHHHTKELMILTNNKSDNQNFHHFLSVSQQLRSSYHISPPTVALGIRKPVGWWIAEQPVMHHMTESLGSDQPIGIEKNCEALLSPLIQMKENGCHCSPFTDTIQVICTMNKSLMEVVLFAHHSQIYLECQMNFTWHWLDTTNSETTSVSKLCWLTCELRGLKLRIKQYLKINRWYFILIYSIINLIFASPYTMRCEYKLPKLS